MPPPPLHRAAAERFERELGARDEQIAHLTELLETALAAASHGAQSAQNDIAALSAGITELTADLGRARARIAELVVSVQTEDYEEQLAACRERAEALEEEVADAEEWNQQLERQLQELPLDFVQQPLTDALSTGKLSSAPSLDTWLKKEEAVAVDRLLANVAPGGRNAQDATPGTVIASPSREHPDYYFQWVRDAAITMSSLVDLYTDDPASPLAAHLLEILDAYTSLQHTLQRTTNPSGTFSDLSCLGEPKFHTDGSAFTGSWGRPQRDGPPLRAIALMQYLHAYNASHPTLWSSEEGVEWFKTLYEPSLPAQSIIKADLEYISHNWHESGFDLWEEVRGLHFFTAMVQLRALREGAELAAAFGDVGAASWYQSQAEDMELFLEEFWDPKGSYRRDVGERALWTRLDGHVFLPHSDETLVTLLALTHDQRDRFPINFAPRDGLFAQTLAAVTMPLQGVGIGRYPEDAYNGYDSSTPDAGNPWFLCTTSAAEVLYRTAAHIQESGRLHVRERGAPFWEALLSATDTWLPLSPKPPDRTYHLADQLFNTTLARLKEVGDSFLDVVRRHASDEGSLSEQFDRVTGYETGARDLTWSYGALLQALRAREALH
ncbi:Glucoamylase, intracellular sporulation-specific [Cryomyces antarcticus]|uniref:glucan 1,4-alpha-glucosidase n=1 Tax=Cryomyces antarcticus TaxID=329879 RepID=A0ABR0M0A2_9PEZI|nr:Glucoamylase, intracellular sporulation-specific [Cryomyces antarcticus]KAK5021224.1 Glucoamylase, intracellular sporulation-specific [Cryomyces antarcticus]KAK5257546.1 Glucoamylase, intracellular sporulation-specific [Cryomyces antarcticus]